MTSVYFVRHCQPDHSVYDDRTRPLSKEGAEDSFAVMEFFKDKKIDAFYSSPYKRSFDTILHAAEDHKMQITTDERLRERKAGIDANNFEMFKKRWSDKTFAEAEGESIGAVQKRNIEALFEILDKNKGKTVVIGTHGTALSSIFNYFEPSFNCDDFLRIIDFMPYIVRLDFDGRTLLAKTEEMYIEKEFNKA
ncbi:MAG: histidine phosphatase family protein [Spirochaetaceae bacterium]|nr:histidine phosphatase family protein [Spirochaetaceae bacterium]